MRRFLLLFAAVFLSLAAFAAEELKYQCLFGKTYNSEGVQNYSSTWKSTNDGYTWTIKNFNNNNNGWSYVKCGSKSAISVASVTTQFACAEAISTVTITIDAVTTSAVNSIKLYSSTTADFASQTELGTFKTAKGDQSVTISSPTANLYYKIEFDMKKASSNGPLQLSSVSYYADVTADPTDCRLSFKESAKTIIYGTEYTLPTLSNPNEVNVTWSSRDETVASFDAENNLQIHKAGTTTITATLADKGTAYTQNTSASYELTIKKGTPVFAYTTSTYDYEMKTGGEGFAAPTLNNPGGLVVTYSSDKSEVATVSADGIITPVTRGTAVITATGAANDLWNGATATLTINITKNIPTLTFSNTEVSKHFDEVVSYTGEAHYTGETLTTYPADLEITYSVDNAEVASINETTGELTFTGALGTVTVTATSTETAVYESQTATYTVTIIQRYAYLDQNAVLVTDVNDLQEGDIIIIVNQAASVAMSTEVKTNNFGQTEITLSEDNTTITSINDETVLLIELEKSGDYWLFKTLNRLEKNGYLLNTSLGSNYLKTVASVTTDNPLATIAIAESGVATVKFNKGGATSSSNRNWLRYNSTNSPQIFSCYYTTQSDVYIYKANVPTFAADLTIAPDGNEKHANVITLSNVNISNGLAFDFTGYNVYLNGTELGGTDVDLSYLPFVPDGKFTISNGTYTYPIAVTWPITDFSTIEAKVAGVEYWAWKDAEHKIDTDMWYLDAVYTIAPDCAVPNLYFDMTCTIFDEESVGEIVKVDGNKVEVGNVGFFMIENDEYSFTTHEDGAFIATLSFPFYVKTALKGMMLPADTEKLTSFVGVETLIVVNDSAVVPQPGDEGGKISGVESVVVDSEGAVEYYNLQGVRVEGALTPGIYIRRTATGTSKVAIR